MSLFVAVATCTALASAQELPEPSWKKTFEDVEVSRVKPDDLPSPEESKFPTSLQSDATLPKPTSLDTLRATSARISDRVVEVISVERSRPPLRQTPVVVRGHAVWISAKEERADPVLVTNYHWLKDSAAIFVRPPRKRKGGALPEAERRTVRQMQADADPMELLKSGELVPAELESSDEHRNLVVLKPRGEEAEPPATGLGFFDYEGQSPTRVYGFSHQMGSTLVETTFLEPRMKKKELVFFLQANYPAILGAPIVTGDGHLIGITSMRHPHHDDRTLVIPPGALRKYVERVQGLETERETEDE